jgi:hypothetical protein
VSSPVFEIPLRGDPIEVIEFIGELFKSLPAGCSVWTPTDWDRGFPERIDDVCVIDLGDTPARSKADNVALLRRAIATADPDGRFVVATGTYGL